MTRRRLIIGGGFQGMMSASAAAKAGALSELIVTEQAIGPVGAPRCSAGLHLRKDPSSSLTRSCAVALVVMAGSAVSGVFRPVAVRVEAGPGEISNDRDQFNAYRVAASSIACLAVITVQTYRPHRSLRARTISPVRRDNKVLQYTRGGTHLAPPSTYRGVPSASTHNLTSARLPCPECSTNQSYQQEAFAC
ncbi:hypothetical protein ABID62_009433 [Bradyrhizobium sp. S3.9.1]